MEQVVRLPRPTPWLLEGCSGRTQASTLRLRNQTDLTPRKRQRLQRGQAAVCMAGNVNTTKLLRFPRDYYEVISQAQQAANAALVDGKALLEVEFPTAGLDSTAGDAEGGVEMTRSMEFVRQFCTIFARDGRGSSTRIFFPDVNEVASAQTTAFEGTSFQLDYLTKPSGLNDIGLGQKVNMAERARAEDRVFVVAYPYFNVNEMLAVEELYRGAAERSGKPLIVFNGELDRIRSGYYPSFFYPKLGKLAKTFLPMFETVYYLHNFKGRLGGKLFRAYPGPWQVLRRNKNEELVCIHTQDSMPSLKEVALNILPSSP